MRIRVDVQERMRRPLLETESAVGNCNSYEPLIEVAEELNSACRIPELIAEIISEFIKSRSQLGSCFAKLRRETLEFYRKNVFLVGEPVFLPPSQAKGIITNVMVDQIGLRFIYDVELNQKNFFHGIIPISVTEVGPEKLVRLEEENWIPLNQLYNLVNSFVVQNWRLRNFSRSPLLGDFPSTEFEFVVKLQAAQNSLKENVRLLRKDMERLNDLHETNQNLLKRQFDFGTMQ